MHAAVTKYDFKVSSDGYQHLPDENLDYFLKRKNKNDGRG